MGWMRCDPDDGVDLRSHEGHVAALVADPDATGGWRDLTAGDPEQSVSYVQVVCSCGWRTPRLHAPLGTMWRPCTVEFDCFYDEYEDAGYQLWADHMDQVTDPASPYCPRPGFQFASLRPRVELAEAVSA